MKKSAKNRPPSERRENKYAEMSQPQAEFDFHDIGVLSDTQIVNMTRNFIADSVEKGLKQVLIITGKGTHSRDGVSFVKPIVERTLRKHEGVLSFGNGRRDRGGEGAIEVKLKKN